MLTHLFYLKVAYLFKIKNYKDLKLKDYGFKI